MIFAAGFGTRMGALTKDLPKPMLELRGQSLVSHAVDLAKTANIETIFANTHYLADRLEPHLRDLGVTPLQETPRILDTGGGLKAARTKLSSPTLTTSVT